MRRRSYMIGLISLVFAFVMFPVGTAFSSLITNGTFEVVVPSNGTGGGWTSSNIDSLGGHKVGGG